MPKPTPPPQQHFRLSDQVIGQLRELLQLSMISGTNFVDNCRAVRLECTPGDTNLTLSSDYVEGWNKMAKDLHALAETKAKEMAKTMATPSTLDGASSPTSAKTPPGKKNKLIH